MSRHRISIAACALLVSLACGAPGASAAIIPYSWGPLVGGGYFVPLQTGVPVPFTSNSGRVEIDYNTDFPDMSVIKVDTGAGYGGDFSLSFAVGVGPTGVGFTASNGNEGTATVFFMGASPGPLGPGGFPLNLDSLIGSGANVGANGGFHDAWFYSTQSVPEPPGLLLGAIGVAAVAFIGAPARTRGRG